MSNAWCCHDSDVELISLGLSLALVICFDELKGRYGSRDLPDPAAFRFKIIGRTGCSRAPGRAFNEVSRPLSAVWRLLVGGQWPPSVTAHFNFNLNQWPSLG